jgi:hypothetical protein
MVIDVIEIIKVIFAVGILSFAFKDNPVHRLIESLYIGVTAGYLLITNFNTAYQNAIQPLPQNPLLILPIILGLLMYTRLSKKFSYLSKYSIAFITAIGVGLSTRTAIQSEIIAPFINTAIPLFVTNDVLGTFGNIIIVVSIISTISYFTYSFEHKGSYKILTQLGISLMMITFGASAANILLSRSARVITMLGYIYVPSGIYVAPIMIVLILISIYPEKIGLKKN